MLSCGAESIESSERGGEEAQTIQEGKVRKVMGEGQEIQQKADS